MKVGRAIFPQSLTLQIPRGYPSPIPTPPQGLIMSSSSVCSYAPLGLSFLICVMWRISSTYIKGPLWIWSNVQKHTTPIWGSINEYSILLLTWYPFLRRPPLKSPQPLPTFIFTHSNNSRYGGIWPLNPSPTTLISCPLSEPAPYPQTRATLQPYLAMQLVLRAWLCLVVFGVHADVDQICLVPGTAREGYPGQKQQRWCQFPGHVFLSLKKKL